MTDRWYKIGTADLLNEEGISGKQNQFLPEYDARSYRYITCQCGMMFELWCQEDNDPEYYTYITTTCKNCNAYIKIKLPVN